MTSNIKNWLESHLVRSNSIEMDKEYKTINNLHSIRRTEVDDNQLINNIKVLEVKEAMNGLLYIIDDVITD